VDDAGDIFKVDMLRHASDVITMADIPAPEHDIVVPSALLAGRISPVKTSMATHVAANDH